MSEDIGYILNSGNEKLSITVNRFYGGKNVGTCLCLSTFKDGKSSWIMLNKKDLEVLVKIFEKEISPLAKNVYLTKSKWVYDAFYTLQNHRKEYQKAYFKKMKTSSRYDNKKSKNRDWNKTEEGRKWKREYMRKYYAAIKNGNTEE